jgi:hypothetical protein
MRSVVVGGLVVMFKKPQPHGNRVRLATAPRNERGGVCSVSLDFHSHFVGGTAADIPTLRQNG